MQYVVTPQMRHGKQLSPTQLHGRAVRGTLLMEKVTAGKEAGSRLARLLVPSGEAALEPLHDAYIDELLPDALILLGFEYVVGRTGEQHAVRQTWRCEPAENEDLRRAESMWSRLAGEVSELREQLGAQRQSATTGQAPSTARAAGSGPGVR